MKPYQKHMMMAFVALLLLLLIGHFLPQKLKAQSEADVVWTPGQVEKTQGANEASLHWGGENQKEEPQAFVGVEDSLIKVLKPISVKKKKGKTTTWILQKGMSMPIYILGVTQLLTRHQCDILQSKEDSKSGAVYFEYKCPKNTQTALQFEIGNVYLNNASELALLFVVDTSNISLLNKLKSLKVNASLLVNPNLFNENELEILRQSDFDIWAYIPMEPENYPLVKAGEDSVSLLIDGKENQWNAILKKAFAVLPHAKGMLPYKGERAWVNQKLMDYVWNYTEQNKLKLLNPFVRLKGIDEKHPCLKNEGACVNIRLFQESMSFEDQLNNALLATRKVGSAVQVLPLKKGSLQAIQKMQEAVVAQGTIWKKLSALKEESVESENIELKGSAE